MQSARDDLSNVMSGLGTGRDKNAYQRFTLRMVSAAEVVTAYRSSGLTRKVHDIYPLEMTRAGRDWQTTGNELDSLWGEEKRLKLWAKLRELLQKARLFGGAALYIGVNRGSPSDPITASQMRAGDLKFIHVLSSSQLQAGPVERDPSSEFFGEPEFYRLTDSRNTLVDPSRIIPLIGQANPDPQNSSSFWGDPLLMSLWTALTNSDLVHQTAAALLPEIKADTISIQNLGTLLMSGEGEQQVVKRIAAASLMQSMFNVRLLDGGDGTQGNPGDKWETRQLNLTGFPQFMEAFISRVAAETDIPVTRLAGTSPGGLNQSGNNEQRDFEKAVSSKQETELRPVLERLDPFIAASSGVAKLPYWSFAPLSQLSEGERWDIEKKRAETVQIYVNTGAFNADDLAASARVAMSESDMWPGLAAQTTAEPATDPALASDLRAE